jgi:hypothetical protein
MDIQPDSATECSDTTSTPSTKTQLATFDASPNHRDNKKERVGATGTFVEPGGTQAFLPNKHPASTSMNEEEMKGKDSHKALMKTRWVEITFKMAAIASLVAIVVTMAEYNKKEQPAWKYTINLNTLIAMHSTLLRECMVVVVEEGELHSTL